MNEQEVRKSCVCEEIKSNTSVIYRIKRGDGELSLPPCKLHDGCRAWSVD